MNRVQKTAVSLMVAGTAFALWGLGTVLYGRVMAHMEVAWFRSQGEDVALWDAKRIHAYKTSLHMNFAPPLAVLRVPALGIEAPVLEGTSDAVMNRGVGHIPESAMAGEDGNMGIAGHRDGFFRALKDVKLGQVVELERQTSAGAKRDEYKVEGILIVPPTDLTVMYPSKDPMLTLVTCYPFYFVGTAPKRFVVKARLIRE